MSLTDFSIGDDPARAGAIFVAAVEGTQIAAPKAGVERAARISYRRAGEPTPTVGEGTMVLDADLASGSARGTGPKGEALELTWKCLYD